MPFDPKVRNAPLAPRTKTVSSNTPALKREKTVALDPQAPAFHDASGFEANRSTDKTAEGRRKRGGVADDSIGVGDLAQGRRKRGGVADDSIGVGDLAEGRRKRGGVADDSIGVGDLTEGRRKRGGVADDSIGRRKRGGVADDSIGRRKRGGVADDSIGFDVVRDALVGPDTDPTRMALRAGLFQKLETPKYLAAPSPTPPANASKVAAELSSVFGGGRTALAVQAQSNPEIAARVAALLTSTKSLSAETRRSLVTSFARGAGDSTGAVVQHIAASPTFGAMKPAEQAKVATVLSALDPRGVQLLGALFENTPQALSNRDGAGKTALDSLATIATQPLNTALAGKTTTQELLSSALLDVVNPNRIEQGTAPTCTVASMQFELVADEPGEYLRLLAGLTGPSGQAKMRNGGVLTLERSDADARARDGRNVSQALFQSAAMEYANGRGADFDPVAGKSTAEATGDTYSGLKPAQQTQILRQLFGVNYQTQTLYNEADGKKALATLRGFDAVGARNRPIILDIDQGDFNHAVTLERVSGGRVYFRDPYGALRSMTEDVFPKVVVALHRPNKTPAN